MQALNQSHAGDRAIASSGIEHRRRFPDVGLVQQWFEKTIQWPGDAHLTEVRPIRAWVGRNSRVTIEYFIELTDGETVRVGRLQVCPAEVRRHKPHTRATFGKNGLANIRIDNQEMGLHCCTPDRDKSLRAVRSILKRQGAATVLSLSHNTEPCTPAQAQRVDRTIVSHRIGRRCSIRLERCGTASPARLFVKVVRRAYSSRALTAMHQVGLHLTTQSKGRYRAPVPQGCMENNHILVMGGIERSEPMNATNRADLHSTAELLKLLHGLEVSMVPTHTPMDEFRTVYRWVDGLRQLGYAQHSRLRGFVACLAPTVMTLDDPLESLIHRDFYDAQLMRSGESIWVTDLDTLARGHLELDLATFAAHLILQQIIDGVSLHHVWTQSAEFFSAYRRAGAEVSEPRLRFYLSCALARLGALHLPRNVPEKLVKALWTLADQCHAGKVTLL